MAGLLAPGLIGPVAELAPRHWWLSHHGRRRWIAFIDGRVSLRTRYYTASSLDGFLATADNSLEWLFTPQIDQEGPLGYVPFITSIGALAMGATTHDWLMRHLAETSEPWAYDIPCWVFTHRPFDPPERADLRFTQADIPQMHAQMTLAAGGRDLWIVGGGDLAGQFADHGLLDEVTICWAPVTLGSGAPLLPPQAAARSGVRGDWGQVGRGCPTSLGFELIPGEQASTRPRDGC